MKKILLLILCALILTSCGYDKKYEKTVFSMDTQINLTAYGRKAKAALIEAKKEIKRINDKFSISVSDIKSTDKDREIRKLIDTAESIRNETDGAFDIRIAPVMRIWGFYSAEFAGKKHRVPTDSEINEALSAAKEGIYLDFGAIAKGYCADRVTDILKKSGVESAVLSFGGNVALLGKNPEDEDWTVGIQNPFDDGIIATVKAHDTSIVTSGDYVRYFEYGGKKYHHIINPFTGYPARSGLASVTVIAQSSTYADCLSTALFVMGKEKAVEHWQKKGDFEMILITENGEILCTTGVNIQAENVVMIKK